MWIQVSHVFAAIHCNRVVPVEGQLFVWVDGNQNDATVSVDRLVLDESHSQVVQDGRFIKVRLVGGKNRNCRTGILNLDTII